MPVKTACCPLLSNYPSLYSASMVFPEQLAARSVAQPLVTQTLPSHRCQGSPAATPLKAHLSAGAMTGCCCGGGEHPLIQSTRHTVGSNTQMYRGALYVTEAFKSRRYILGSSPGLPETIFRSLASRPAPPAIPPPPPPPFSCPGKLHHCLVPTGLHPLIIVLCAAPTSHHHPSDLEHVWAFSLHSRPTSRPVV